MRSIAILHNHRSVERQSPLRGFALGDGARAGHDHRALRHAQRFRRRRAIDLAVHSVEQGRGPRQDHAGSQHGARADLRAFIDAAVSADQHVVFDDHGRCVDRLQHAADLCRRADVDTLAHLGAGTDQRVRIDHCAFVNIGADVDEHRRHANDRGRDVSSSAHRRASGNHAHQVAGSEVANRIGILVNKREHARVSALRQLADAKAQQDPLLHPLIGAPAAVGLFGSANRARGQGIAEPRKGFAGAGKSRLHPLPSHRETRSDAAVRAWRAVYLLVRCQ